MAYVGTPVYQTSYIYDTFSGNNLQTTFTLQVAPGSANNCLVTVGTGNNATVVSPNNYNVSGQTLIFFNPPATGVNNVVVRYLGLPYTAIGLTRFSGGTTGLTPVNLTGGDVTVGGVLVAANGGTGNTTGVATNVSGVVATANGGTGLSVAGNAGNFLVSDGTNWTSAAVNTFTTATWTISEVAGKLVFSRSGVAAASLDTSGNFVTLGNVTAFGTP